MSRTRRAFVALIACGATLGASGALGATVVGPPPCTGALALYTRIGTLANLDGSHRRAADVEARLAILRDGGRPGSAARVGSAYVDGEGDVWVGLRNGDARALAD